MEKGSTQKEKRRDREKEKGGNKGEEKEKGWRGTIKHHQRSLTEYFTIYNKIVRKEEEGQSPANVKTPERSGVFGALRGDSVGGAATTSTATTTETRTTQAREGRDLLGKKDAKKKLTYLEKEASGGQKVARGPPKTRLIGGKRASREGEKQKKEMGREEPGGGEEQQDKRKVTQKWKMKEKIIKEEQSGINRGSK